MRVPMIVLGLGGLVLAGCATPLQQCLYEAEHPARVLERELAESYASLSRGYSIERVVVPRLVRDICVRPNGQAVPCTHWEQDVSEVHHRIDRRNEQERIALLERQLERARAEATSGAAQCRATYPES